MPLAMVGQAGPQTIATGAQAPPRLGNQGELVTSEMSGKHFEQLIRGNLFLYHNASIALLLSATTGGHPTVINPVGSGVVFVPLAIKLGYISGTTVISSILIAETLNVGGGAATAAPILTATLVAAKNAYRGGNSAKVSSVQWSPATNTFTAAPTVIYAPGINLGAAAPTGTGTYEAKLDGTLAFYPGTAMSLVCSVTTTTALFQVSIIGAEIPIGLLGQ